MRKTQDINALVKLCQQGDRQAFDALTLCYQDKIKRYINHKVNSSDVANDLTQDVFLKAFTAIQTFRFEASFYTWLYQIARNKVKQFYAKEKKYNALFSACIFEDLDKNFALNTLSVEHLVYLDELAYRLDDKIKSLPKPYQECLYLRDVKGLNYEEIAKSLACPIGTIRSRLSRARSLFGPEVLRFS